MSNKIILISGDHPDVGKTYVADSIVNYFNNTIKKDSFARPLKELVFQFLGLDKGLIGDKKFERFWNLKSVYQMVGEGFKQFNVTIWAHILKENLEGSYSPIVVDDLRFPVERQYFPNALHIHVKRDVEDPKDRIMPEQHSIYLEEKSNIIFHNGEDSFQDLFDTVEEYINRD